MARAVGLLVPVAGGAVWLALALTRSDSGVNANGAALVVVVVVAGACVLALPALLARATGRRVLPVDAMGPTGVLAGAVSIGVALTGASSPFVLLELAVAVVVGALVPGRRLALALPTSAAALVGALVFASADAGTVVADALVLFGFGMLGRALFFGTLKAVRMREESRVDGEMLRLYDDARLFGLVGSAEPGDERAQDKRLVAQTLAVRDGCYRILRLGARALKPDAAALYLLDGNGKELVLKEQLLDVDGPLIQKLSASAGALGLALKKGQAIRLLDADGPAVQVHRRGAKSVLVAPLREAGRVLGVLVFDRNRAALFDDDDESLALSLCEELVALLRTERVLERLDVEHKKIGRIFSVARAFGGVVHVDDAMEHTLQAALDLAPQATAAVVVVERAASGAATLRVCKVAGAHVDLLACLDDAAFPLDDDAWVGRAILQRTTLPHVALAQVRGQRDDSSADDVGLASVSARGLYRGGDGRAAALGDLRAIPLFAQGDAVAALVVALPKGERLRTALVESLAVVADLAGVAVGGARLFETVERQATTDGLTGLYNRRTMDQKLAEAVARAKRMKTPLCTVLVDVDHFKSVNDTYGHSTGDDVLKAIARALADSVRTSDVVARYGGEEICAILEGTDAAGAAQLAERMRVAVKSLRLTTDKGPLSVTASFGVGVFSEKDMGPDSSVDSTGRALLERADAGLYKAKQSGRDRVVVTS